MPDDFVPELVPLSHVTPVRPHPSSIRQERRRRHGGRGNREKGKKEGEAPTPEATDKVTLKGGLKRDETVKSFEERSKKEGPESKSNKSPQHIDIRI